MKNIAVLVLAAGKSSRMKSIKQLLKINNKTFLEITLEIAKNAVPKNVFCVLGANAVRIQKETDIKKVDFILNKNFESGLSSSIVSGLNYFKNKNLNFDGVLILLADQPDVNTAYLKKITNSFKEKPNKIIASSYNNNAGVPALFPKKYFDELLLLKGDKGAKEFLQNNTSETIEIKRKHPFTDLDTQEEYQSYLKSI